MAVSLRPQLVQRAVQWPSMRPEVLTLSYTNKDDAPTDQLIHIV
jgi:hypothetical protein